MSYWEYWNLSAAPFARGVRQENFFRGQSIEEALARIEFICAQRRSLATLVGPAGIGKSCLIEHLATQPQSIRIENPRVCKCSMIGLTAGELVHQISRQLGGRRSRTVAEAWTILADCFATGRRAGWQTLLLVDDVESCGADAENDLVRVVRSASESDVSVVLTIESHLASTVSRWLVERSDLQIELPLWDVDQTRAFLQYCLACGGRYTPLFTDGAIDRLHELSRGTARRLVQLADLALIAGAVSQADRVDEYVVSQIAQELPKQPAIAA